MPGDRQGVTRFVEAWAFDQADTLWTFVAGELRKLAVHHLGRVPASATVQPTVLVNEAFLRLSRGRRGAFPSRAHFFAFASKVIREVLIDSLRRRRAIKRGGKADTFSLDGMGGDVAVRPSVAPQTVLEIHDLLSRLERRDPRRAQVVELRFFGGLTNAEIATVTERSVATVERDWQVARRWLAHSFTGPG